MCMIRSIDPEAEKEVPVRNSTAMTGCTLFEK